MRKMHAILWLVASCFLLSSDCGGKRDYTRPCDDLELYNNTGKPVYTIYSFDYPDTSLNFQNPAINPDANKIKAYSKGAISTDFFCPQSYFQYHPIQKVMVFVFDAALLDTTPWQQVRQKYQILRRYELSEDTLNNNHLLEFY